MTTISITREADKESSIVENINYDAEKEILIVTFKCPGTKYQYKNVDENLFEAICEAKSMGSFLTKNVFFNPSCEAKEIV